MMQGKKIFRFLAMLFLLVTASFTLSGCSNDPTVPGTANEQQLANEHKQCWQKEVLGLLYDTMGKTAMESYAKMTQGAMTLMMVAFAVWFSLQMIQHVSSLTTVSNTEIWDKTLRKFVLCFACGYLASSTDGLLWVLNMIVFPIYNAFLELGGKILEATSSVNESGQNSVMVFGETITGGQNIVCKMGENLQASLNSFPQSPRTMMECLICAVNERLTLGNQISIRVMKAPGFMAMVVGVVLLVSFMILKLGFVFYLVDAIFKMAVMVTMLPIFILAYPFGPTQGWTKTGLKSILSSAVFMMIVALMIAVALLAVLQIIQDNQDVFNPQTEAAEKALKQLSPQVLSLLLIAFLVKSTMSISQKLVSAIIGATIQSEFQRKLAAGVQMVGSLILAWLTAGLSKSLEAVKQAQKVQKMVKKVKESHVGRAATKAYNQYKKVHDKYQKMQHAIDRLAGRTRD